MMRPQLLVSLLIAVGLLAVGMSFAVSRSSPKRQAIVQPSGAITGQVLSPDGQPISGASVYAEKSDFTSGRLPMFPTNDRGEFTITNLTPGTYKVSAAKEDDGYPPTDYAFYSANGVNAPRIAVYEGQTTSYVVHLGLKAAKLVGRVVDSATDKLVKDAQITLRRTDNSDNSFTTVPDVNGKIDVLAAPVPFTVEVSAPGYEKKHLGSLHLSREEIRRLDVSLGRNQ